MRSPLERHNDGDRAVFEWSTDTPLLNARYRLEWRFRGAGAPSCTEFAPLEFTSPEIAQPEIAQPESEGAGRASRQMRNIGIVQRGSDLLRQRARHYQLPREEVAARETAAALLTSLVRLEELHDFSKGVGLAAPQIGRSVAAAVVRPPDRDADPVVLLNPRVVRESADRDEQYEGCLSFFDYRGLVKRPLRIQVEHARYDGARVVTSFERAMARLVAHEIDHLEGRLYVDRMRAESNLVPVANYQHSGRPWVY